MQQLDIPLPSPTYIAKAPPSMSWLEWIGSITGMLGAAILCLNLPISKWGWAVFLISNFSMIAFASSRKLWGLLTQQIFFTGTSALGIARYIV